MREIRLLFTAPLDFDTRVLSDIVDLSLYTRQKEAVITSDLTPGDYQVWVCNPTAHFIIDSDVLALYPHLELIVTPSTGTNHIDLDACKARGVDVLSLLDDRKGLDKITASSEFTMLLLLGGLKLKQPRFELAGKTVGLVGYGRIGRNMARYIATMRGKTNIFDPYQNCAIIPLEQLFSESDAVVICCKLTNETKGMITEPLIRSMKRNATLVNTSRGEVIDEPALLRVMKDRPDLRIMLDVVAGEAEGTEQPKPLRDLGAVVTPHIAGETFDSRTKAAQIVHKLIKDYYE